jgi:hypothetical protein
MIGRETPALASRVHLLILHLGNTPHLDQSPAATYLVYSATCTPLAKYFIRVLYQHAVPACNLQCVAATLPLRVGTQLLSIMSLNKTAAGPLPSRFAMKLKRSPCFARDD